MRCPQCAERNSVAARKCEFCGEKFKKKPFPLGLKLACGGVAVAITASVAASYVVPKFVDPEQSLGRAAKQLAAGPKSVEHANKIKKEFGTAVKEYLKTAGDDKTAKLTTALQKLLPSSAFEVHIVDLPRGLRVVEVDTVLQATSYLVMKTSAGLKVFDLPGFEVFDDAQILNDNAGPVLALLGHTSGLSPHKPIVRTYALMPDYIHDETEKLVPPLKVDGTARFAKNGHDIHIEFSVPSSTRKPQSEKVAYGMLKWKDAHYVSDFGASAASIAAKQTKEAIALVPPPVVTQPRAVTHPSVVTQPTPPLVPQPKTRRGEASTRPTIATTPPPPAAPTIASTTVAPKIIVRGFSGGSSDAALAAVPMAATALKQATETVKSIAHETKSTKSSQKAEVICSGATLRARPERGSAAMNNFGKGTTVTVIGKEQDWYHVRANGQDGYIYSSLLSVGSGSSATSASNSLVAASPAPASGRSSRRRSRRSQERMLLADAAPRKQSSRRDRQTMSEPILVP